MKPSEVSLSAGIVVDKFHRPQATDELRAQGDVVNIVFEVAVAGVGPAGCIHLVAVMVGVTQHYFIAHRGRTVDSPLPI